MRRRPSSLAAAVLATALLAGCGIPPESAPRQVDPPRGPFQAIQSPTPSTAASGAVAQRLYMVRDGKLVAVTRHVDRVPSADTLLAELLAGPTDAERDAGITSALQGGAVVSAVDIDGDQAAVELVSPIEETGRTDVVLAYAQLVCTLTAKPGISGVTFTRDQQPIRVPRADGLLSRGPLVAADYADLLAQR